MNVIPTILIVKATEEAAKADKEKTKELSHAEAAQLIERELKKDDRKV